MGRGANSNTLYGPAIPRGQGESELEGIQSDAAKKFIYCAEGQHYPSEGLVTLDGVEQTVVVDEHGEVTGFWEDGTLGVSDLVRDLVNESDSVYCREHIWVCEWHEAKSGRSLRS